MTRPSPCQLWAVGTWDEAWRIGGVGLGFTPDGRHLLVQDASKVLRMVDTETGRTVARLESPDLCGLGRATFSRTGRGWPWRPMTDRPCTSGTCEPSANI